MTQPTATIRYRFDQGITCTTGQANCTARAASGQLTGITAPEATLAYTWDGPLPTSESWTGSIQGAVRNTWDNDFRITGQSINSGQAISFAYDADGLLTQSGSLNITRSSGSGQITGTKLGGITTSQFYNTYGELNSFTTNGSSGAIYSESLTRNNKGQITSKTETLAGVSTTTSYTYDNMGRLLSVTQGTQTETYTYDLQGNRTIISSGIAGTYDAQDRLLKWNSDGNLQNRGDASFSYDLLGNLKSVVLGSNTYSYAVDGANRRIAKKLNGTLQKGWLYRNGLNPAAELDAQNRVTAQFIYADKAHVPSYMVKTAYANSTDTTGTSTTYRIISDHLGSVRMVVDSTTGAIAQSLSYDTWGKVTADSNPGFQPFGFAGGLYDPDTQMVRFGARDYDPETGRWTSKDPIRFAGGDVNLYGYVLGDPVNRVDPEGLAFGINMGECYGEEAAQYWADKATETGNPLYNVLGALASLWTRDTSNQTAIVLGAAYLARNAGDTWSLKDGSPAYTPVDAGNLMRIERHMTGSAKAGNRGMTWHSHVGGSGHLPPAAGISVTGGLIGLAIAAWRGDIGKNDFECECSK